MATSAQRFRALVRRFMAAESGGAGLEYVVFAACWSAAVSGGLYFGTPLLTAKFDVISHALRGSPFH